MHFTELRLKDWILQSLSRQKITTLTSIQESSLPLGLNKRSLIVTSQTGSGKTLCYLLPILQTLQFEEKKIQSVIILPTKELARQVYSKILEFKKDQPLLKASLLIGNEDAKRQTASLKNNPPQIVVGTVSRVFDFINTKVINKNIDSLVLDEADMLFDLGFTKQITSILQTIDTVKLQKFACSATLHESLSNSLKKYLKDVKIVSTSASIWTNPNISHNVIYSTNNLEPLKTLYSFVGKLNPYFCIIFLNTKKEAEEVYKSFLQRGLNATMLHKDLTTRQRKNIFREIKENKYQFLIATDLVSRGLDIEGADIVISVGLPEEDIWYIHRAGRTGRNNVSGKSYIVYDGKVDNKINRLSKKGIKWTYLFLAKNGDLIEKKLNLRFKGKLKLPAEVNKEIKKIVQTNSKKVKPGYKKKIKEQIHKLKQKEKRKYVEGEVKKQLLIKNIRESKRKNTKKYGK